MVPTFIRSLNLFCSISLDQSDGSYTSTHPTVKDTFTWSSNSFVSFSNIWLGINSFRFEAKFNCRVLFLMQTFFTAKFSWLGVFSEMLLTKQRMVNQHLPEQVWKPRTTLPDQHTSRTKQNPFQMTIQIKREHIVFI